jgi:hypothetical protein
VDSALARRHCYSCAAFAHGAEWRLGGGDGEAGRPVTADDYEQGLRVVRGPDWEWGDQDGGAGSPGTVTTRDSSGWLSVKWDAGGCNSYRAAEKRDLCRAPDSSASGLKAGDAVEYYSKTNGKWVPAKVAAAQRDRLHVDLDVRRGAARINLRPVGTALLSEALAADGAGASVATAPSQWGVLRWRFRVTGGGNWQCGVVTGDSTVVHRARRPLSAPPIPSIPKAAAAPPLTGLYSAFSPAPAPACRPAPHLPSKVRWLCPRAS